MHICAIGKSSHLKTIKTLFKRSVKNLVRRAFFCFFFDVRWKFSMLKILPKHAIVGLAYKIFYVRTNRASSRVYA